MSNSENYTLPLEVKGDFKKVLILESLCDLYGNTPEFWTAVISKATQKPYASTQAQRADELPLVTLSPGELAEYIRRFDSLPLGDYSHSDFEGRKYLILELQKHYPAFNFNKVTGLKVKVIHGRYVGRDAHIMAFIITDKKGRRIMTALDFTDKDLNNLRNVEGIGFPHNGKVKIYGDKVIRTACGIIDQINGEIKAAMEELKPEYKPTEEVYEA